MYLCRDIICRDILSRDILSRGILCRDILRIILHIIRNILCIFGAKRRLDRFVTSVRAPANTPTPTPDHFETIHILSYIFAFLEFIFVFLIDCSYSNDQQTCDELICASATSVSALPYFLWCWGWGCFYCLFKITYIYI